MKARLWTLAIEPCEDQGEGGLKCSLRRGEDGPSRFGFFAFDRMQAMREATDWLRQAFGLRESRGLVVR